MLHNQSSLAGWDESLNPHANTKQDKGDRKAPHWGHYLHILVNVAGSEEGLGCTVVEQRDMMVLQEEVR